MTFEEKKILCNEFFNELSEKLKGKDYIVLDSCSYDVTKYLIKKGTADKLSYYGKPEASFRISDHWNWKSSIKKCAAEDYVQCLNVDMPWVRRRLEPGKATKPVYGWQVGFYGSDYKYHAVYGEVFDRKTRTWNWLENSVDDVLRDVF